LNPKEKRPLAGNQGAEISTSDFPSISESSDVNTATVLVTGVHVVVVTTSEGKYRRRTYFNLPSAQRAVDRATMAGHVANIILCQLIPVEGGEAQ
jgi:hypothetical protein